MNTNSGKTSTRKAVVRFYMAEDVRQELHGKISLIGLYTDNVLVANIPADAPEPSEEKPVVLRSLGFLFSISGLQDKATVRIEIEVDGEVSNFADAQKVPFPGPGRSVNIVMNMAPCLIRRFGQRTIRCLVDEQPFDFQYEFRRGTADSPSASKEAASTQRAVAPKSKKPVEKT